MVDRCICCGEIIPEGTQICINCRYLYMETEQKHDVSFYNPDVFKTGADKVNTAANNSSRPSPARSKIT